MRYIQVHGEVSAWHVLCVPPEWIYCQDGHREKKIVKQAISLADYCKVLKKRKSPRTPMKLAFMLCDG